MSKIKILSPDIYNKIAAGEVVENPAAAVKELVENSIDAGATRINVDICGGGMESITVSDNGCGIDTEDIDVVFLKHSTSKLADADALFEIKTLGFRGEALASIAAVSRVKLTTRTADSDAAVTVTAEDGVISEKTFATANVGTSVEVSSLFYNTPGRKKFLKSAAREGAEITKYISRLILTAPELEISYRCDGRQVFRSKGGGVADALYAVYGADCLRNCLAVSAQFRNVKVTGYAGSPDYTKPNGTYQTLSVNGRCVTDKNINAAVMQAFRPYLMTRKYPFYVLNAEVPYDEVDVNVHPKKSEVRFADPHKMFTAFYVSLKNVLQEYSRSKIDGILGNQKSAETPEEIPVRHIQENYFEDFEAFKNGETMTPRQADTVRLFEKATEENAKRREFDKFVEEMDKNLTVENALKMLNGTDVCAVEQAPARFEGYDETCAVRAEVFDDGVSADVMSRVKILGAAFNTYLILELDDKLIFVDQHAAHERILYDEFMERGPGKSMQPLLLPYVFTVKDDEAEFIDSNMSYIKDAGFELEPFGRNTYRITSVSVLFVDVGLDKFVEFLLSSVAEFRLDDRRLIVEKIAQKACKAAVKAGYCLNETEIRYIVKAVCDNKIVQCPHGRPVTFVFTKTQMEKSFKRIV